MSALPVPGLMLGMYPERSDSDARVFCVSGVLGSLLTPLTHLRLRRYRSFVDAVRAIDTHDCAASAEKLQARLGAVRAALSRHGFNDRDLAEAFAIANLMAHRTLGIALYDTQLIAARLMLDGRLAEMATGEGKTYAAAVCAATAALAGIPVHVITANEYLAARDADALRPFYSALGLSVASVTQSMDIATRQRAYAGDVTYCTAREVAFDYLRDGLVRGPARRELHRRAASLARRAGAAPTLLRGLCMAIVDEADSVLLDEARIPLLISDSSADPREADCYRQALALAAHADPKTDFTVTPGAMSVQLTDAGRRAVEAAAAPLGPVWRNRREREEMVATALAALNVYQRDRHYIVHDQAIAIVDETTGRIAEGRRWSRGLHQLVELKEGCKPTAELAPVAQITFQRFFRRYLRLAGMSGTLKEARSELLTVYGLEVVKVPLHRPCRRALLKPRIYSSRESLWRAVADRVAEVSASGRPVLIGTDSVADSEGLSRVLARAGLDHAVLNARHDAREAETVARAGEAGRITVATNMAGRGTDIPLTPEARERGGLHLVCCQHNASARIDRQLVGRCARQGDPGSAETMLFLNKPGLNRFFRRWVRGFLTDHGMSLSGSLALLLLRLPQRLEDRRQRGARRALLIQDLRIGGRSLLGSPAE